VVGAAAITFAIVGRGQWFYGDDWAVLVQRGDAGPSAWMMPHQQHWMAPPTIVYQVLWHTVGLHSYHPYRAVALAAHLATGVALWAVLRRSKVSAWTATVVASSLLFFGAGSEVAMWAVLMTFSSSLALGFAHLLIADRAERSAWTAVGAILCGIGAMMSSGVGLFVLAASGLALLARRGWRWAMTVTVPPFAAYAAWYLGWGRTAQRTPSEAGDVVEFAMRNLRATTTAAGGRPWVTVAIAAAVVVGLAFTVWSGRSDLRRLRFELAVPVSFAAAAVGFAVVNGVARAGRYGVEYAERGRFLYVALALLLPVVGFGIDAVAARSTPAAVLVWGLVLVSVASNVGEIDYRRSTGLPPSVVLAVANSPWLDDAPPERGPFIGAFGADQVTVRWLQEARAAGRIPSPTPSSDDDAEARARLALDVAPVEGEVGTCEPLTEPIEVVLDGERQVATTGVIEVQVITDAGGASEWVEFGSFDPKALVSTGDDLRVIVRAAPVLYPATLCQEDR
jgi:MFS family permease